MIIGYSRDEEEFDYHYLIENNFNLETKDYKKLQLTYSTNEENLENKYIFCFVGFLINDNNNAFSILPKKFKVNDIENDSKLVFSAIIKHIQKSPSLYIGDKDNFNSNFPFTAFFQIYDYYVRFGLHFEVKELIKPNIGEKINWKQTIRLSNKYLINNKIIIYPFFNEKKNLYPTLLTECICFAINYTIEKFSFLIDFNTIDYNYDEYFFLNNSESIIDALFSLRNKTFKDNLISLIDNLIDFLSSLNEGGNYYIKHYSFSSIWEDMVMDYLRKHFKEIKNDRLIFGEARKDQINFYKPTFKPNLINTSHSISPDYYYVDNNIKYIFDAKYYKEIKGIDYKQVAYYIFLNEYHDSNQIIKHSTTHSALILPGEEDCSRVHFKMNPLYNSTNQDLIIYEQYLNIKKIIEYYTI